MIVATSVFGSALPALTLVIAALIQMSIVSVSQASTVSRVARSGAARLIGIMVQILQSKTYYFYSYFYTLLGWHQHQVKVLLKAAVSVRLFAAVLPGRNLFYQISKLLCLFVTSWSLIKQDFTRTVDAKSAILQINDCLTQYLYVFLSYCDTYQ